jgi:hypothetical protein
MPGTKGKRVNDFERNSLACAACSDGRFRRERGAAQLKQSSISCNQVGHDRRHFGKHREVRGANRNDVSKKTARRTAFGPPRFDPWDTEADEPLRRPVSSSTAKRLSERLTQKSLSPTNYSAPFPRREGYVRFPQTKHTSAELKSDSFWIKSAGKLK